MSSQILGALSQTRMRWSYNVARSVLLTKLIIPSMGVCLVCNWTGNLIRMLQSTVRGLTSLIAFQEFHEDSVAHLAGLWGTLSHWEMFEEHTEEDDTGSTLLPGSRLPNSPVLFDSPYHTHVTILYTAYSLWYTPLRCLSLWGLHLRYSDVSIWDKVMSLSEIQWCLYLRYSDVIIWDTVLSLSKIQWCLYMRYSDVTIWDTVMSLSEMQ